MDGFEIVEFSGEAEVVYDEREANVIAALEELETDWHNSAIDFFYHLIDQGLTGGQVDEIKSILARHRPLFVTHLVDINTGDARPISTRPARVSPPERVLIKTWCKL